MEQQVEFFSLSPTWHRRLLPYYEHGSPFARENRTNRKTRLKLNVWAFFLGIIYYFFIGIPKRGLGLAFVSMVIWLILFKLDVGPGVMQAHAIATQVVFAMMANFYYWIRVTEGRDEFDPLKDVRGV